MRNNYASQSGFTLIELMITITIIALLAAIAIPQYQAYVLRTQITRAYSEINGLRSAVEVCESDGGVGQACVMDSIESDMLLTLPEVSVNPSQISAVFGQNAHQKIQGGTVLLVRNTAAGESGWACTMNIPGVPSSYYPMDCR